MNDMMTLAVMFVGGFLGGGIGAFVAYKIGYQRGVRITTQRARLFESLKELERKQYGRN